MLRAAYLCPQGSCVSEHRLDRNSDRNWVSLAVSSDAPDPYKSVVLSLLVPPCRLVSLSVEDSKSGEGNLMWVRVPPPALHKNLSAALKALQHVVENRIAGVRLSFDRNYFDEKYLCHLLWVRSAPLKSDYRIPRSWKCPDLLSAMYLQLYLLITDSEPMRRCQNPACGLPFPATRKNRMYCNDTCRSNARHYR